MPAPLEYTSGDLDILTRTLYGECRGEPLEGQQGVAWVIRNRACDPGWWTSIQDNHRDGRVSAIGAACLCKNQFSCWNVNDPNLAKLNGLSIQDPEYVKLSEVARSVLKGEVEDPTGHASHYEVIGPGAKWAEGKTPTVTIGRHQFYCIGRNG